MIRRFHHGESTQFMNTANLEGILISHFSNDKMKRVPNKLAHFNSKKATQAWEKGKRIEGLQLLGVVIQEILSNGDTEVRNLKPQVVAAIYILHFCSISLEYHSSCVLFDDNPPSWLHD